MALLNDALAYPTSSDGALPYPTPSDGALPYPTPSDGALLIRPTFCAI